MGGRSHEDCDRAFGWLAEHQGRRFDDDDALHRWSVTDLDGFWTSIRDFFGVREHTPADRVLGRWEMPEAESFTGATLNYAEHALRRADGAPHDVASIAHSQTRDEVRVPWAQLLERVDRGPAPGWPDAVSGVAIVWRPTCPTSPKHWSPTSPRRRWERCGRAARRSSAPAASSTASARSSRPCRGT
jgi:hypothetical protein